MTLAREPDAHEARLSLPGRPDRFVSLPVRTLEDCLMEELRRLAPDETYGQALTRVSPSSGPIRRHDGPGRTTGPAP